MEIGTSEKTLIEVDGQKFALAMLATLADPKNVGQSFTITVIGDVISIEAHACPLPVVVETEPPQPTRRARRKDPAEE